MQQSFVHSALFEHRFWLQVLGDHARFIHGGLAPAEKSEFEQAADFIAGFDRLLEQTRRELTAGETIALGKAALALTTELRAFKLHLLKRQLTGKIDFRLSPTFVNHMLNELGEYMRLLPALAAGEKAPVFGPVHHHVLWLSDAIGHAESLKTSLDMTEKALIDKSARFAKHFTDLYLKSVEMAGYLRTNMMSFPALARFNKEAELEMRLFQGFLNELEELRMTDEALGPLMPLIPDHMFREECYYLMKLSETTSNVKEPDCDPGKPRVE